MMKRITPAFIPVSLLFPLGAVAQSTPGTQAMLEEVIVTAQKREENLQDVGLSVQSLSGEAMKNLGIRDVDRLELVTPGVTFGAYGNDAKIAIRGTNSNNTFADNSSIAGMFVDGVYKPRASQQTRPFFDIERLEVLKGPQGTLYGRNTFGGAINVYTNDPNFEETAAEIEVTRSRYDAWDFQGFANIPVNDQLAVRVAAITTRSDGHIENTAGRNMGILDRQGIRFKALWVPTSKFDVTLRLENIEENGTTPGVFSATGRCRPVTADGLTDVEGEFLDCNNPRPGSAGTPPWPAFGADTISRSFMPDGAVTETNVTLTANWALENFDIKSISSYTDYEALLGDDGDFSAVRNRREWMDERAESWTQEVQLLSSGAGPLQWVTGAYYSNDELFFQFSTFDISIDDDSVRPRIPLPGGGTEPVLLGTPLVSGDVNPNAPFARPHTIEIDTFGLFAEFTYSVMPELRLIAGARGNYEDKDLVGASNFSGTAGNRPVEFVPFTAQNIPDTPDEAFVTDFSRPGTTRVDEAFDEVTWRAGVEYDLSQDVMTYFTWSTGFLSGALSANGTVTDQQESEAFEFGVKGRFLNGRLTANLAAYYNEFTNLATQIQNTLPSGTVVTDTINGGEIEASGLEFETALLVGDSFTITFNSSYMDAEYGTFGSSNPFQLVNGQRQAFVDLEGETPPWSPEFTATLMGSYSISLGNYGTLTPSINSYYTDGYSVNGFNLPDIPGSVQDSYTKTDFRIGWQSLSEKFHVEAFVENIEDEDVLQRTQIGGDDLLQTTFGFPRNYGVTFGYRF